MRSAEIYFFQSGASQLATTTTTTKKKKKKKKKNLQELANIWYVALLWRVLLCDQESRSLGSISGILMNFRMLEGLVASEIFDATNQRAR